MNKYFNATVLKVAVAAVVGYYVGKNGVTIEIKKAAGNG
jgi:hypothetical protein